MMEYRCKAWRPTSAAHGCVMMHQLALKRRVPSLAGLSEPGGRVNPVDDHDADHLAQNTYPHANCDQGWVAAVSKTFVDGRIFFAQDKNRYTFWLSKYRCRREKYYLCTAATADGSWDPKEPIHAINSFRMRTALTCVMLELKDRTSLAIIITNQSARLGTCQPRAADITQMHRREIWKQLGSNFLKRVYYACWPI
ncbi:hypothetical protein BD779DRAFT_920988 [Infundibulicybe gibba]|nr:hypothetical protein BD779DRAFT_920988 [Infundibulicybe gibba]